jgi:glucose/arabinose dehydrogenase
VKRQPDGVRRRLDPRVWGLGALVFLAALGWRARAIDHGVDATAAAPGLSHHRRVEELPPPKATQSAVNDPRVIARPRDAWPRAPQGFTVSLYARDLPKPRALLTAPNGDVFVTHKEPGEVLVLRGRGADGLAQQRATFAAGLDMPFGLAFYPTPASPPVPTPAVPAVPTPASPAGPAGPAPEWLYVAETSRVVRYRYAPGALEARGAPERIAELAGGGRLHGGGHWTRDLAFSRDDKTLFVSVGSRSNVDDPDDHPEERRRALILEMTPEGKDVRVFASGLRNAVGIAVSPRTGELWASVNERDELGDDLPADYVTHVERGGFYGWPWFYLGAHADPRLAGRHPELAARVIVPDVLLAPHSASMQLVFYDGAQFPAAYHGDVFAPQHGSWNRSVRSGYEVVRVPVDEKGRARGTYEDFLTGFVTPAGDVWGRPVGVAVAADGALLVSDDVANCIWRVDAKR